ncbi:MAG: energy-coupling factor transporter transmembrane component T family protein [Omnitrophica WOR_2 bacterium]
MAEALSLYRHRDTRVDRLNPLTKLTLVGFLLIAGLALPGIWVPYLLFLVVLVPLALLGKVFPEFIRAAFRVALPFAISVLIVQGFFWPHGTPLIAIGPVALKQEGLRFAVASIGRILIVLSAFLWFAFTTRPDILMIDLAQRGVSSSLAYMIVSTIQIVPRFQSRASAILDAQKARGLETGGNLLQRARAILPLVMPLILSSLVDVEERALAIESRAFNHPGVKTSLIQIDEAAWEPPARLGIVVVTILMLAIGIWLRIHP